MADNSTYNSTWITNESTTMEYYNEYDCDVHCNWCGGCESCIEKGCNWNHDSISCRPGQSNGSNKCTVTNPFTIGIIIVASLCGLILFVLIIYYARNSKSNEKHKKNGISICSCIVFVNFYMNEIINI